MGQNWTEPIETEKRETGLAERGAALVKLLELADSLLPLPVTNLDKPTFRELLVPRVAQTTRRLTRLG